VRITICIAAVFLSSGLLASHARADLITFSFSGINMGGLGGTTSPLGSPLSGTFTYDNATLLPVAGNGESGVTWGSAFSTDRFHTFGTLNWTNNGQTYSAAYITALATPGQLLLSGHSSGGEGIYMMLTAASLDGMSALSPLTSLPANLDLSTRGATYALSDGLIHPGPVPVAPEPSGLLLAALGATALVSSSLRRRGRR
jgi:hypothetical protein